MTDWQLWFWLAIAVVALLDRFIETQGRMW